MLISVPMDAYQELLKERNRLAELVSAQSVQINALEQTTALKLTRRLIRFRRPLLALLKIAHALGKVKEKITSSGVMAKAVIPFPSAGIDKAKPTVLVLVHEATRTGAPILGWNIMRELRKTYNVVAVLQLGGPLQEMYAEVADVVVGPLGLNIDDPAANHRTARRLALSYDPHFVVANSIETRHLSNPLAHEGVPVVAVIHEFASNVLDPIPTAREMLDRAGDIVFPCRLVEQSFGPFYGRLDYRRTHVIPQGQSDIPGRTAGNPVEAGTKFRARLGFVDRDALLVVGLGLVDIRKGVDIFIATAMACKTLNPAAQLKFVWIGKSHSRSYSGYVHEQIERSGLDDTVIIMDEVSDLEGVYQEAGALFVSSRLDPLPNVAIDAAMAGKPVVCFENGTGMAEFLAADAGTKRLVVPYMDITSASRILCELATDKTLAAKMGAAVQAVAKRSFDMSGYVAQLAALGEEGARTRGNRAESRALLEQPGHFDPTLYAGKSVEGKAAEEALDTYLNNAFYDGYRKRGMPGFHPERYASQIPDFAELRLDPLTHYLRSGKPPGNWLHKVIRLDQGDAPGVSTARVALQAHFYYVDHFEVFLKALAKNRTSVDLFLSTGSEENRQYLLLESKGHKGKVTIDLVPNKGRDIGPFIHTFREKIHGHYDFVGHLHGKRSAHTATWDPTLGERWRNFLFQHLLGNRAPTMDIVLAEFAKDDRLGIVFPEDPNVIGWDFNFEHAKRIAERMGLKIKLPKFIDFPIGTMFWARVAALEPLLRLDIPWDEFPSEPLPVDGTILHALERLMPLIAEEAGYEYATTYFPGIGR